MKPSDMKPSDRLLLNNKSWAQERRMDDPEFFVRLSKDQHPQFLWIGCSDSRAPANQITGTDAGEVFVHRNIANLCRPHDPSLLSVLQYAVDVLNVQHVIVCGHYGCGGVRASMGSRIDGPIGEWLNSIQDVNARHREEIDALPPHSRADRLCEWNVREGVNTLAQTDIIQNAWKQGRGPWLHGWVYALSDGILKELVACEPGPKSEA